MSKPKSFVDRINNSNTAKFFTLFGLSVFVLVIGIYVGDWKFSVIGLIGVSIYVSLFIKARMNNQSIEEIDFSNQFTAPTNESSATKIAKKVLYVILFLILVFAVVGFFVA